VIRQYTHIDPRADDGVALLLTLVFIVLLTALVLNFSYDMQVDATLMGNESSDRDAYLAARSGIATALSVLHADVMDNAANADGQNVQIFDGLDEPWALPGDPLLIRDAVVNLTIRDEYGKLNLNALIYVDESGVEVEHPVLASALETLFSTTRQLDKSPVDVILDWLDNDDIPRANGAESDYYESLDAPMTCKNGPMDSIEELLLLPGITPEIYFGSEELQELPLYELLTVHGNPEGKVNANTASQAVINAIQTSQPLPPPPNGSETPATQNQNGSFTSMQQLQDIGLVNLGDPNAQPPIPPTNPIMFDIKSEVFRIWSDAQLDDTNVRIEVFARRDTLQTGESQMFRIIDWRVYR
jgi:general secretion pathway protein K